MEKNLQNTLTKISKSGYWRVRFLPAVEVDKIVEKRQDLKDVVAKNSLQLRGWDYPHIPTGNPAHQGMYLVQDHYEGWIDWDRHKEVWRIFENGQYIHLFALREDWSSEDVFSPQNDRYRTVESGKILEVIGTIYTITEIFAFLRNLYASEFYKFDVNVEISLRNTQGRKLFIWDPSRAPLFGDYECHAPEVTFSKRLVTKGEILSNFQDIALSYLIELFSQFQWENPPIQVLKEDQNKLLERRL